MSLRNEAEQQVSAAHMVLTTIVSFPHRGPDSALGVGG